MLISQSLENANTNTATMVPVNEEGSAEISVGAIDDGLIKQCVKLKTVGGVCQSFIPLVG